MTSDDGAPAREGVRTLLTLAEAEARPVNPAVLAAKIEAAHATLAQAAQLGSAVLASSLSAEDQILTDMIVRAGRPIAVLTLETGRLPQDTLDLIPRTEAHFGIAIEIVRPDPARVEGYVREHGLNAFYESVALRKACCGIRKVEPLERALAGRAAWVTGQRREQSLTRTALHAEEQDAARGIVKFNPLADWTWAEVLAYARAHDVPLNPMHARGYPSIGCDPCTRAVRPFEDPRAGRWWWEEETKKECGLHWAEPSPAATGDRA